GAVYAFWHDCGLRTTKSVWPIRGPHTPVNGGDTCAEPEYRAWVVKLQSLGFEIGYHMTSYHSSLREETRAGLEQFAYVFGQYPATMANHVGCTENIPTATLLEHALLAQGFMGVSKVAFPRRLQL